jgi:integrase
VRPGELAGLRRDAIGNCALTISQSVWGQRVQTPKSRAGIRTFAISGSLAEDLRKLVGTTPDKDYGLVFVTDPGPGTRNPGGKPLSMDSFRRRVLNPILEELAIDKKLEQMGVARCGNYAFRHMNATLLDTLNTPMKTRQKRLGHAQIETTLKHYTYAIDANDQLAADQIVALLSPSANQPSVERLGGGFMWLRSFKEMPPEPRELEEKTEAIGIRIKRETR